MRAIAAETGYAIGTLYEYFPNREAVLSGYVRYCLEDLCQRLKAADAAAKHLPWRERLRHLMSAMHNELNNAPYFDSAMMLAEPVIADTSEQRKAYRKLCKTWEALLAAWPDLPQLEPGTVETLVVTSWGARRYGILLELDQAKADEVDRATSVVEALLLRSAFWPQDGE